jgi:hypothetical protein
MTFTSAAPGAAPPARRPKTPLAPLGEKIMFPSRSGRRECWSATTADKEWFFERQEAPGTPWTVIHLPTKTIVDYCIGTLTQCRAYVGSGAAAADLKRLQAEKTENASG